MTVDRLMAIAPPPGAPSEARGAWQAVEARLRTGLPTDYKRYIEAYGTGCLAGFIWLLNPFSSNPHVNLFEKGEETLQALRELRAKGAYALSYHLFPEPDGLLPWGVTDNGDILWWLTVGAQDDWPVIVTAARDQESERYEMSVGMFLAKILTREIVTNVFPEDFPGDDVSFAADAASQ